MHRFCSFVVYMSQNPTSFQLGFATHQRVRHSTSRLVCCVCTETQSRCMQQIKSTCMLLGRDSTWLIMRSGSQGTRSGSAAATAVSSCMLLRRSLFSSSPLHPPSHPLLIWHCQWQTIWRRLNSSWRDFWHTTTGRFWQDYGQNNGSVAARNP